MKIKINELLEKRNTTMYWLAKETNTTYVTIHKLCNNKTESIKFDLLERICLTLECDVNDILILEHEK